MVNLKEQAAKAAIEYVGEARIIGVGTGSTVNYFIQELKAIRNRIEVCVASSKATELLLRECGLSVVELNGVDELPIYVDGADEVDSQFQMIKGGGGALAREKIIATVASQFICIADESKYKTQLGQFPIAVEVLPMARSVVARELVRLGGSPEYRFGFTTDNGNIILDVYGLDVSAPRQMEEALSCIPGVVDNGIFARRLADAVVVAGESGVVTYWRDNNRE